MARRMERRAIIGALPLCLRSGRSTRRTPSGPATIAVRARPMNKPCSMTPGMAASRAARACGSAMRCNWASSSQCPPSVTKAWPFCGRAQRRRARTAGRGGSASTARRVAVAPNGAISIGSGKRPSVATHFDSSAITTIFADAEATIFSRSSAPPPPLIRVRSGAISSAPSTVRSSSGVSSSVVSAMPSLPACARVASEVGTATTSSPARTRSASSSTKCLRGRAGAEPEPHARTARIRRRGRRRRVFELRRSWIAGASAAAHGRDHGRYLAALPAASLGPSGLRRGRRAV